MTYHRLESLRPYFDAWNRENARARREYRVWPLTVPGAKPQCVTGCGRGVQYRDAGKACAACVAAKDSAPASGVLPRLADENARHLDAKSPEPARTDPGRRPHPAKEL